MVSFYKHEPLPNDHIRILTLLPAEVSSEIECKLDVTKVHHRDSSSVTINAEFEALSYTWGEPVFPQIINCNGLPIKVTQNLFDALTHLRDVRMPRKLWIDAICINQQDNEEKSKQVPLMKHIYRNAAGVVIWLGLPEDDPHRALDLIKLAATYQREESGKASFEFTERFIVPERFDDELNLARGFPSIQDLDKWQPLISLLSRPWFSRCWIVQESALATKALVRIGKLSLDWADLCVAVAFFSFKLYANRLKGFAPVLGNVFGLCLHARVVLAETWRPTPLMNLLESTLRFKATDPRDRIFAFLGLAEEELDINVDYSITLKDLYTDVSRHLLLQTPVHSDAYPLRVLANVKHYPPLKDENENMKRAQEAIPSWVPRWHDPLPEAKPDRKDGEPLSMFIISGLASSLKFCAAGRAYHAPIIEPKMPYEISFYGFVFSTIDTAVNPLRLPPLSRPLLWDLVTDIYSVRPDLSALYPTGESFDEVLALTLTMSEPIKFTANFGAETYHAIDFQHFCLTIYEQTISRLTSQCRIADVEALHRKWGGEYQRLKDLVGIHVKCPNFSRQLQAGCVARKLFSLGNGYIGLGDITLKPGDYVCILLGGRTPFILRPAASNGKYILVGECYVHGIMHGQALQEGLLRKRLFTLI